MPSARHPGFTILETLLALLLLGAGVIAVAPPLARTAQLLRLGRTQLEGVRIAVERIDRLRLSTSGPCGGPRTGQDSGRLAVVNWSARPSQAGLEVVALIQGRASPVPAETLAAMIPCIP